MITNLAMDIKVNGIRIRQPVECKTSRFNLTKSGRALSGKMKIDLVPDGKKRKLELRYPVISGREFDVILDLIDTDIMIFNVAWLENDTHKTARMYVGEIQANKFRTDTGAWYWKDVEFHFIEE